jgi:3-keto-disaccharide hydrolase
MNQFLTLGSWLFSVGVALAVAQPPVAHPPVAQTPVARPQVAQTPSDPPIATIELFTGDNLNGLKLYFEDLSVDADDIWKVKDGMLRATGKGKGYLRTEMAYADYKLHLEWRWPNGPGNSGVLLHVVNGDIIWPKGFECQLASGHAGDLSSYVDARSKEEIVSRNPTGYSTGRLPQKGRSPERPLGEWNTLEIVAEGDTLTIWINGKQVNRMTEAEPSAGMIGFQAEGSPIDLRNITLTPLPRAKDLHAPMPKESP